MQNDFFGEIVIPLTFDNNDLTEVIVLPTNEKLNLFQTEQTNLFITL